MQPKQSSNQETVFAIILGGVIGFIGALIVLLLEMGDKMQEPFLLYWFTFQSPVYALKVIISSITIGCLVFYIKDQFALKQKESATLNEFISMITHQMRAPLSSVVFSIDMFLRGNFGKLSKLQKEHLQKAHSNLKDLVLLIQDLFDITKLELGRLSFLLRYMSLQDVEKNIRETIQKFAPIAETKGVRLTSSFSLHHNTSVHIDWTRINQVIENLLENAIHYTPIGGEVSIYAKDDAYAFLLSVSDTGIGIPQVEWGEIFSKFFRASNARKEGPGTGIGLYLCKQIINAHHGKSWFASQENRGSTFYFSLPVAVSQTPGLKEVEEFLVKI